MPDGPALLPAGAAAGADDAAALAALSASCTQAHSSAMAANFLSLCSHTWQGVCTEHATQVYCPIHEHAQGRVLCFDGMKVSRPGLAGQVAWRALLAALPGRSPAGAPAPCPWPLEGPRGRSPSAPCKVRTFDCLHVASTTSPASSFTAPRRSMLTAA